MKYAVLITKEVQNGYVAQALAFPDIVVCGHAETAVLAEVQAAIAEKLSTGRVVQVEVPSNAESFHRGASLAAFCRHVRR